MLAPLGDLNFMPCIFFLECSEKALRRRLEADIAAGVRTRDVLGRSLPLYRDMPTLHIDVSDIPAKQAALQIYRILQQ